MFVECEAGTSGTAIYDLIVQSCSSIGLDFSKCRGLGFNGASNMAGKTNGAAAVIQRRYLKALYVHCAAHRLNLCIAQTNSLTGVISLFDTVTSIANFFNYFPNIQKALESRVESLSIEK